MDKLKNNEFLKKFFCTPKVPLTFYYTPLVAIYIFILLVNIGNITGSAKGFLWFIVVTVIMCIVNYSYAWFSDYMLYTSKSRFVSFVFMKSFIFRKGSKEGMMAVYNSMPSETVLEQSGHNRYRVRQSRSAAVKQTFQVYFIIFPLIKFFIAYAMLPFILITPFLHIKTMEKYYTLVELDALDQTDEVNMF